MPTGRMQTW